MALFVYSTNLSSGVESGHAQIRVDAEELLAARPEQSGGFGAVSGDKDAITTERGSTVAGIPVISPASSSNSESSASPAQNKTRVQKVSALTAAPVSRGRSKAGCPTGADQQRRIAGVRTPTVTTQALPRSDADGTGGVTAGETAIFSMIAGAVTSVETRRERLGMTPPVSKNSVVGSFEIL